MHIQCEQKGEEEKGEIKHGVLGVLSVCFFVLHGEIFGSYEQCGFFNVRYFNGYYKLIFVNLFSLFVLILWSGIQLFELNPFVSEFFLLDLQKIGELIWIAASCSVFSRGKCYLLDLDGIEMKI